VSVADPRRGELWYIDLDPTKGQELKKERPAVVVSADALGILSLKLIVPLTGWNSRYEDKLWLVRIDVSNRNGLAKPSAADTLQTRSVDKQRFTRKLGMLEDEALERIVAALAVLVEAR